MKFPLLFRCSALSCFFDITVPQPLSVSWEGNKLCCVAVCRSIVQFHYGEDGIDVLASSFLKQFDFLSRNAERLQQQQLPGVAEAASKAASLTSLEKEAAKASKYVSRLIATRHKSIRVLQTQ